MECRLFEYIGRKAREMNCRVLAINGMGGHVHILIMILAKVSLAEVIKNLKGASSHEFAGL